MKDLMKLWDNINARVKGGYLDEDEVVDLYEILRPYADGDYSE